MLNAMMCVLALLGLAVADAVLSISADVFVGWLRKLLIGDER